jgi:hypothetical protein
VARARLPHIAPAAVAFAGLLFLVAFPRSAIPLIDGDVWWHIRAGQEIVASGAVPRVDTWSIVGDGHRWVSQDWLTNVGMGLLADTGEWGWTLLSVGFALAVVASLGILLAAVRLRLPSGAWLGPLLWLTFGLTIAGPTLGVRVQVVDLPLAASVLWLLWKYIDDRRTRWLVGLPVVALVWANLHAGWLLLFLFGGAVLVGEAADRLLGRTVGSAPLARNEIGALALALVASAAVMVINPSGADLYLYPISAGIGALPQYLAEWAPPRWDQLPGQLLLAFLVIGLIPTLIWGRRSLRAADLLILVGLFVMALSAARFLLVAGPTCAAIVAVGMSEAISRRKPSGLSRAIQRMGREPASPGRSAVNLTLVGFVLLLGTGITLARVHPAAQREAIAQHMPVGAVEWILSNEPGDRPFNTYSWGGYLGLRQPGKPIYIDGRADIYGEGPIRDYARAVLLEDDPSMLLDRHGVDYVLFNVGTPLARWLDASPEWDPAYTDALAGVWVRPSN